MLGVHPRTGKEIRVIQTDASVWRENKTLFYSEDKCVWDTVYEGDTSPTYRILLNVDSPEDLKAASTKSKFILIAKAALGTVDEGMLKTLGINNLMCLDEVHLIYPHLGGPWDGTAADAAVMVAGLVRYRRIAGIWNQRAEDLKLVREDKPPAKLWWVTQFFKHGKSDRASEIRKCLRENNSSRIIDKILLLNESPQTFTKSDKIDEEIIGHRLTYQDVFERIYDIPDNTIVVFANADIFIDDASFKELWNLNLEDKFLALLRYDLPLSGELGEAKIFGPRADSQDTWIVRSDDVKKRDKSVWESMNFQFGKMGCDNALALEAMRAKFLVVNPSQTLKTYHVHASDIRNYSKSDVIDMPVFHYVQPSGIHDLMPEFKLPTATSAPAMLKNVVRGSEDAVKAWKDSLKVPFELVVQPSVPQLIEVNGPCFQTTEGLVFDSAKMYIGDTELAKLLWNNSKIHGLMPTLDVGRAFAIPWPVGAQKSREVYCLRYISKVFRLWAQGQGEFFGSEDPAFEEVLQIFNWNADTLPIVAREDNTLMWCKGAVGFVHTAEPILKEDMEALRCHLTAWVPSVSGKKLVIMEDGIILTNELVLELEAKLEAAGFNVQIVYPRKTSLERVVDVYSGAWGIVCACGVSAVAWNWILPEGANVFEVNSSKTLGLEVSTASSLVHWFVKKDAIVEQVLSTMGSTVVDANLPTIFVPAASEGFFSHPGDSFREMVRLWQKAGYVNVCEHSGTQVWWGAVGAEGVLLYDRPTNEWRLAAPAEEREWKLALFGNPKPCEAGVAWTFWPRRPSLVEGVVLKGWEDRVAGPVFYGKCENAVQERRRKGDWESVCEEWIMVKGDTAHSLTQSEYLERLAGARFGLCLPGYGLKCHREVECMAMGCVPIVSKGVDMDSYAVPPVVGVHYLRVEGPEDVEAITLDREAWETMSAACRAWWEANASVEGSFKLTKRLIDESGLFPVPEVPAAVVDVSGAVADVSGAVADVSGADLSGADLSGADLSGAVDAVPEA